MQLPAQDTAHKAASNTIDTLNGASLKTAPVPQKEIPKVLTVKFLQRIVTIQEEDILSNTLSVINYSDLPVDFTLNVNTPYNWTDISDGKTRRHLNPGDSLFVPVRIIPALEVKGGTEYVINVFLLSPEGSQLTSAYFFAHTQKISKWNINVLPENRIYFRNHCDTASFQVNVSNEGNQPEDLVLSLNNVKKQGMLTDTNGRILHTNFYNFQLDPNHDTTLSFKMKYTGDLPNFKTMDLEGYTAQNNADSKTFPVWISGQEAKKTDSTAEYVPAKNVTFVKLTDIAWANPYSGEVFPLTVDMNTYNILGIQPVMNINLHGDAFLDNQAHLFYVGNLYYSTYALQHNYFNGDNFYAGYFDKRGDDIQVGQLGMPYSYGVSIGGWGAEGDYRTGLQNTVGGIIVDGNNNNSFGAGIWDKYKFLHTSPLINNQLFITSAGMVEDFENKINTYFITETGGLNITKNQRIYFSLTGIEKDYYRTANFVRFFGGAYVLGYTGSFIQHRLLISDFFIKTSYDTNALNKNRITLSNSISYELNTKWRLLLQNVYYSYPTPYYTITPTSYSLTDYLYFMHKSSPFAPYIFYNIFSEDNLGLDFFGIGDRYSYYNKDMNFMLQAGVQGGYNHLTTYPYPMNDYFSAQPNLLMKYHTISLLAFYNYGPNGIPSPSSFSSEAYPQMLMVSLRQQYQFFNKHFVLDHGLNYTYFNQYSSNTIDYNPELYYFINGWRFKVGLSYSFNSTNIANSLIYTGAAIPNENVTPPGPEVSNNIYINFGIKKDFGIPVPKKWAKYEYKTVHFIAFLDLNGDGKMEPNESVLEDVVVSVTSKTHRYEALTNEKGEATIFNLCSGGYYQTVQSLRDLKGWFNSSSDSLFVGNKDTVYLPFTKGVKLFGAVIYHPGPYSILTKIDLSHIQISVTDSTGKGYSALTDANGEFMIYIPAGKYTLTMNDDWMDDRFTVAQNNISLNLSHGIDNIYQSFYISEKVTKAEIKQFGQPGQSGTPTPPDEVPHH